MLSLHKNKPLVSLTREEMKQYIYELQEFIVSEQESGRNIDTILDETDIFDEFEEVLSDREFPVFVITILNGFKSDTIVEKLLDIIDEYKSKK